MGEPGYDLSDSDDDWVMVTVSSRKILSNDSIGEPTGEIEMKYYYNGSPAYTGRWYADPREFNLNKLSIGEGFLGKIDDVRIYNYGLSGSEVYDVYNREKNQIKDDVNKPIDDILIPSGEANK